MNEEMQLKYLYFLTYMSSGTSRWKAIYNAWKRLGNSMEAEEYSKLINKIRLFDKKYAIKKKKC